MASLQASYAIIEGVDWVQICMCSISYCRLLLPVKILHVVTKRPFDSTLESATATFGRQFKQRIAGQPRTVVLANVTCVHCRECLGYIKHERFQRAYNNYDGLTSASVTSMRQNSPMNIDYTVAEQFHCSGSKTEDFYPFHNSFPAARDSLENI